MAKVVFHSQEDRKEKSLLHIKKPLEKDEFFSFINKIKKNGSVGVLWFDALKNLNYLEEFSRSKIEKAEVENGVLVPFSLKETLFNNQNVYPFFLKEGFKKTEIYTINEKDFTKFTLIATSPTNKGSVPSIFFIKINKGVLLSIGFPYNNSEKNNLWKAYFQLFLSNLENIENFLKKDDFNYWKYHFSKFDNIPFFLNEKKELTISKSLNLSKIGKSERGVCKNEKIALKFYQNKGTIIVPPLEIVSELNIHSEEGIKLISAGKIIKVLYQDNSLNAAFFPSPSKPTIYFYANSNKRTELKLSYKIHFKLKEPWPEYYFSKINYFSSSDRSFIVHTSDKKGFFINRFSKKPSSCHIEKINSLTPTLKLTLNFLMDEGEDLIIQFSCLLKEEGIKKTDISKILCSFKKKYFEESLVKKDKKSLKVIQGKGEKRINLEGMARELANNFFKNSEGKTVYLNIGRKLYKDDFLKSLVNLVILGYEKRVEEIVSELLNYKRIPYVIYPSGEIIYDYRVREFVKLNKVALHLRTIKDEVYKDSFISPFIKKRTITFKEFNFIGTEKWNKELENPESLYFTILNPIRTENFVVFAPIIPFFIKSISFKNIRVGEHLFDFSFKRKNQQITMEFKNNNKEKFNILFFPLFLKEAKGVEVNLEKKAKLSLNLDRKYLIYSAHYEFNTTPLLEEKEEKLKINFKESEEKKIIYLALEIYELGIKKLVGARLFKGKRKEEERIIIYEPEKSNYIYMYFKKQKVQKTLFDKNNN